MRFQVGKIHPGYAYLEGIGDPYQKEYKIRKEGNWEGGEMK